ncbi:bifunctional folylpolyglutamate synthase/dihydrofolate synthase [Aestuariivivens sediminicola]|uniref:bifunctional folylpolyglutamate synthase/dihydrofolate synthase n=1 Tax=Aestuariivivens sediminicola TaxID=2913560 RepID=UPI001F571485|nr:Mur ligase family protein [Aestuariivivens sediminicola]
MTYQSTVDWMFSQLPMYQSQGPSALKKDLSNTLKLSEHLKFPERKFRSVHVAGTNGKGSTSHMIASVLQEAGYKVGLYTSPHLKDFRERIKINGKAVSKQFVIGFIKRNQTFFQKNKLSFFEMTVGMAFDYLAKQQVDIAIIEVGLGGRLDSTNIILPEVSVITNIGLDHTQFLGETLKAIAYEKGGIIKSGTPVVIGETHNETKAVFEELASKANSKIVFADRFKDRELESDLKGSYQSKNIKTAVQAIEELKLKGYKVTDENLIKGLKTVVVNTGLMGRWQVLSEHPKVICDTAHNREGLTCIMEQLPSELNGALHIVFGVVNDKNVDRIADLLPKNAFYYFCTPNIPRGLEAKTLQISLMAYGLQGEVFNSVKEAYQKALDYAQPNDCIFIGGSTFVVAEII